MPNELNTLYGEAAHVPSQPGFERSDRLNPPHLIHRSRGSVTMRIIADGGMLFVDWGDGAVSGANMTHSYANQGWKRIRFFHESRDASRSREIFPGNTQDGVLDTRSFTGLQKIDAYSDGLVDVRVRGLEHLTYVKLNENQLSAPVIDQILINLDANGAVDGTLFYGDNPGEDSPRSPAAAQACTNLLSRGWTINS